MDQPAESRFWQFVEHPQVKFIVAIVLTGAGFFAPEVIGYVLFGIAFMLALRAAWQVEAVRARIPFDFHSPITLRNRPQGDHVKPVPAFGSVDFELEAQAALVKLAKQLPKLGEEMEKSASRIEKSGNRVAKKANHAVSVRHRALRRSGRVVEGHAKRLERIEKKSRGFVSEFVDNAKKMLELSDADEDLSSFAASTAGLRTSALASNHGTATYQMATAQVKTKNISRAINEASDRLGAVLTLIAEDGESIIQYCDYVATIAAQHAATIAAKTAQTSNPKA